MKASKYKTMLADAKKHSIEVRWASIIKHGWTGEEENCRFCDVHRGLKRGVGKCDSCPLHDGNMCFHEYGVFSVTENGSKEEHAAALKVRAKIRKVDVDAWTATLVSLGFLEAD